MKTPPRVTSPTENPKPKTKKFFNLNEMTCRTRKGFEHLSSSVGWQPNGVAKFGQKVASTGLRGFKIKRKCG